MDLLGMPLYPDKHLKEQFVSNLTGSSMLEIAALSTIVPALVVLRQWSSFNGVNGYFLNPKYRYLATCRTISKEVRTSMKEVIKRVLTDVSEQVHAINQMEHYNAGLGSFGDVTAQNAILTTPPGHFYAREVARKKNDNVTSCPEDWRKYTVSLAMDFFCVILPILSVFTVLVTCLCILAVDFKIFPRRYAKTETYGTSLMDLGVGSFVVANSLVSRQARNAMSMKWKAAFQSISPLVLLGFGRLIFTTGVDYQVHVGEYGVHWNFFFTLAAVSILTSIINIHPQYCGIFGSLILIGYQTCLIYGLNGYLLSNERTMDIISQNKEGLFSIFGYWGMYLVGVHLGYYVFFKNESTTKAASVPWKRNGAWILSILFWLLTIILDNQVERVSRRMCNLAYVTFVLAQNFQVLSVLLISDFLPGQRPLVLEEAVNNNLLGSFLLANVLTGVVNLYSDTLSASSLAAFGILLGYASILSALVGFAGFCGIKLKFW